jgi:hypothetical protein
MNTWEPNVTYGLALVVRIGTYLVFEAINMLIISLSPAGLGWNHFFFSDCHTGGVKGT